MPIRADNDPRYSRRFLIMGIVAIGFGLYCIYDGTVVYPAERVRGFAEFKADYEKEFADPHLKAMTVDQFEGAFPIGHEQRKVWDEYWHKRGLHSGPDIVMQFIMATVTGLGGLFLISIPLRARGRWIECNETGVTSSWGQSFQYDEVEQVNKRKWRDKGIAKVTYVAGGRRQLFVIDDFKFMREPTDQILFELEQRIDVERITGGPLEPLPGESAEDLAEVAAPTSANEPS
jgi:hypothetical protein